MSLSLVLLSSILPIAGVAGFIGLAIFICLRRRTHRAEKQVYHSLRFAPVSASLSMRRIVRAVAHPQDQDLTWKHVYDSTRVSTDSDSLSITAHPIGIGFTDVCSSSMAWQKHPDTMAKAIVIHHTTLRQSLAATRGFEVKTIGDAFMTVFFCPRDAIAFAVRIHQDLNTAHWPRALNNLFPVQLDNSSGRVLVRGLRVRAGFCIGQPVVELDRTTHRLDYYGPCVNRAARLEHAAAPGTSLLSEDLVEYAADPEQLRAASENAWVCVGPDTPYPRRLEVQELCDKLKQQSEKLQGAVWKSDIVTPFVVRFMGLRDLRGVADDVAVYCVLPEALKNRGLYIEGSKHGAANNLDALLYTGDIVLPKDLQEALARYNVRVLSFADHSASAATQSERRTSIDSRAHFSRVLPPTQDSTACLEVSQRSTPTTSFCLSMPEIRNSN